MASGTCSKCGHTWTRYQNGGHHCPSIHTRINMDIEQSFSELDELYQGYLACYEDEEFVEEEVASAYYAGVIGALAMLVDNQHNDVELAAFIFAIQEMMINELGLDDLPEMTH